MIQSTLLAKQAISKIVRMYRILQRRSNYPLSYREFAASLSNALEPVGGNIAHQTVKNWQDKRHIPKIITLKLLEIHSKIVWQKDFARDILAVLDPENYQPATLIGEQAVTGMVPDWMLSSERKVMDSINGVVG